MTLVYTGSHDSRTRSALHGSRFGTLRAGVAGRSKHESIFRMKQVKSADPAASDLKKAGLKVTLPRLKILQLLVSHSDNHVTAEDVYREFMAAGEEIGLATIYRVLTQFEAAGLVKRHHFEGGQSVFELDEGGHHDHLLCLKCGKVVEFYDEIIEERQQSIAESKGFELRDHSMILYGVCSDPDCSVGE